MLIATTSGVFVVTQPEEGVASFSWHCIDEQTARKLASFVGAQAIVDTQDPHFPYRLWLNMDQHNTAKQLVFGAMPIGETPGKWADLAKEGRLYAILSDMLKVVCSHSVSRN